MVIFWTDRLQRFEEIKAGDYNFLMDKRNTGIRKIYDQKGMFMAVSSLPLKPKGEI